MKVVGESTATICLAESAIRPARQYAIPAGRSADLTALRRAAIARAGAAFLPQEPVVSKVESGSLLIVGGGRMSREMWRKFVELAGGEDSSIVIIPTAEEEPQLEDRRDVDALRAAGAGSVVVLHTTDRGKADDEAFLAPLREATGVWFGGGRQWRLVDVYEGTAACPAFHDVLARGGVIGGSSAGATIQGD